MNRCVSSAILKWCNLSPVPRHRSFLRTGTYGGWSSRVKLMRTMLLFISVYKPICQVLKPPLVFIFLVRPRPIPQTVIHVQYLASKRINDNPRMFIVPKFRQKLAKLDVIFR